MMAQGLMRPQAGNTRRVREDPMLSVQGQKRPGVLSPCDKGKLGKRQCLAQSADTATKSEGTATMLRKPAAARGNYSYHQISINQSQQLELEYIRTIVFLIFLVSEHFLRDNQNV